MAYNPLSLIYTPIALHDRDSPQHVLLRPRNYLGENNSFGRFPFP